METIATKNKTVTQPIFARHETFHPRFGWLKKGFDKSSENAFLFSEESAPAILGVGKNMVKAIRYWCLAYKILQEDANRKGAVLATTFGEQLLGNAGWDPYLEDTSSLWLLHWNLLKVPCHATAWYYAFNIFNRHIFTADDLLYGLSEYKESAFPLSKTVKSSLSSDVNCLIRMYVSQNGKDGFREDSVDSPFGELRLVNIYSDGKQFAINVGPKPGLTPEIIVAACLNFATAFAVGTKTVSISRLLYEEGSPGLCFKIRENELCDAIEIISSRFQGLALSETAGLIQLSYNEDPSHLAMKVLAQHYNKRG
jgi:hypothetical protein